LLSGTRAIEVNQKLQNPEDQDMGVPRNMTGIGARMKEAG